MEGGAHADGDVAVGGGAGIGRGEAQKDGEGGCGDRFHRRTGITSFQRFLEGAFHS